MSREAMEFAMSVARDVPSHTHGVLTALAWRANGHCGVVLGGGWIAETLGLHPVTVRRTMQALTGPNGVLEVMHRRGRASLYRFPAVREIRHVAHQCAGCRAWSRELSTACSADARGAEGEPVASTHAGCSAGATTPVARALHKPGTEPGVKTPCGHPWRSVHGDCPACLHEEAQQRVNGGFG